MGPVSSALVARVTQQIGQHGVVVWYDPERAYEGLAVPASFPHALVATFDGSFLKLRHEIEPALAGDEPQPALVYVPLAREACHEALIEAESAGVVMRPGEQPPARNTRLAVVARSALAGALGGEALDDVVRQVERGLLTLEDLDAMEMGGERSALLGVVFGTHDPEAIALRFLSEPAIDEAIGAKHAFGELAGLLTARYGLGGAGPEAPDALRAVLGRAVLLSDIAEALDDRLPTAFAGAPIPEARAARVSCARLAAAWRNGRGDAQAYVTAADGIDRAYEADWSNVPASALAAIETLRSIERALLTPFAGADESADLGGLLALAERRRAGFWASVAPDVLDQWSLVVAILRLLLTARTVAGEVERAPAELAGLATRYLDGIGAAEPWCRLDTLFRHMERRVRTSDSMLGEDGESLQALVVHARREYRRAVGTLAARFVPLFGRAGFLAPSWPRQREVYDRWVVPALREGSAAYVLVDGLRYEMARELRAGLAETTECELAACVAQVPTITKVGMAALLPFAHQGMALHPAKGSKLAALVIGEDVSSRAARLAYLERVAGTRFASFHLGDLLPPRPKARSVLRDAQLVVITATDELDGLAEQANPAMAHRLMDDALYQLHRLVRLLLAQGVATVVVSSDHGFLLGAEVGEADTMTPPGGETIELHPRVWIGRGGGQGASFVRTTAATVGLEGDLELAFPSTLSCFSSAGGAGAYHHGGVSPQEVFVPVLVFRSRGTAVPRAEVDWRISLGSRTISSPFVTVVVEGRAAGLFPVQSPRVRVEVREGRQVLSRPVSAAYGFDEATGSVVMEPSEEGRALRKNSVLVRLDPLPTTSQVEVVLIASGTGDAGAVVASMEQVPVTLAGF